MPTPRVISSRARELSIICEDRPGTLSHLAKVLGDAKVNIVAMSCTPAGVQGAVRVIVDDFPRAKSALDREHLSYAEHGVLYVEIPNMPGALAEFTGKLAAENINISIAYGAAAKGTRNAIVVFRVSDLEKAASIR